jgi:hypothetical protein
MRDRRGRRKARRAGGCSRAPLGTSSEESRDRSCRSRVAAILKAGSNRQPASGIADAGTIRSRPGLWPLDGGCGRCVGPPRLSEHARTSPPLAAAPRTGAPRREGACKSYKCPGNAPRRRQTPLDRPAELVRIPPPTQRRAGRALLWRPMRGPAPGLPDHRRTRRSSLASPSAARSPLTRTWWTGVRVGSICSPIVLPQRP